MVVSTCLKVMSEDTDVFVFLCHFYLEENWTRACYGGSHDSSSQNRADIWKRRTASAKLTAKPIQLKSLPPSDPVLDLNIKLNFSELCGALVYT